MLIPNSIHLWRRTGIIILFCQMIMFMWINKTDIWRFTLELITGTVTMVYVDASISFLDI